MVDQQVAIDLFMIAEDIVCPFAPIHELLHRVFHVLENTAFGGLYLGGIDGYGTIQFLGRGRQRKEDSCVQQYSTHGVFDNGFHDIVCYFFST